MGNLPSTNRDSQIGRYDDLQHSPQQHPALSLTSHSQVHSPSNGLTRRHVSSSSSSSSSSSKSVQQECKELINCCKEALRESGRKDDYGVLIKHAQEEHGLGSDEHDTTWMHTFKHYDNKQHLIAFVKYVLANSTTVEGVSDSLLEKFIEVNPGMASHLPASTYVQLFKLHWIQSASTLWKDEKNASSFSQSRCTYILYATTKDGAESNTMLAYAHLDIDYLRIVLQAWRKVFEKHVKPNNSLLETFVKLLTTLLSSAIYAPFWALFREEDVSIDKDVWEYYCMQTLCTLSIPSIVAELSFPDSQLASRQTMYTLTRMKQSYPIVKLALDSELPHLLDLLPKTFVPPHGYYNPSYVNDMVKLFDACKDSSDAQRQVTITKLVTYILNAKDTDPYYLVAIVLKAGSNDWDIIDKLRDHPYPLQASNIVASFPALEDVYHAHGCGKLIKLLLHLVKHNRYYGDVEKYDVDYFFPAMRLACIRQDVEFLGNVADNFALDDVAMWTRLYRQHSLDPVKKWFHTKMCLNDPTFLMDKQRFASAPACDSFVMIPSSTSSSNVASS